MNTSRLNARTHPLALSRTHAQIHTIPHTYTHTHPHTHRYTYTHPHTHTHSLSITMTMRAYVPTMSASVRGLGPSLLLGGLFRKYTDVPSADAVTMAEIGERGYM